MRQLYLVPAYGRHYLSADDAVKDWQGGLDFKIAGGGPYCSIRDSVNIRLDYDQVYLIWSKDEKWVRVV